MITTVSQAPLALTTGQRPTIDSEEVLATRLAKARENGGTYEDPALGAATIVQIPEPLTSQRAFRETQIAHNDAAGRSMNVIEKELDKVGAMLARRRPEIAAAHWDFKLVDGRFEVSGLDEDDAKWLESKLNANHKLVDAAKSFISTAVAALETTELTPAHVDYNYLSRRMETYDFSNVAEQLSDKLSFRALLQDSDLIFDSKRITLDDNSRGMSGLNVVANRLTVNNPPIERMGAFFANRYQTATS